MSKCVLLAYRLPREPSTPRTSLWRQLRRLGVAQLADSVVALPLDERTREQLEWLVQDVVEHGGEATIWLGEPGSAAQERALAKQMSLVVEREFAAVVEAVQRAAASGPPSAPGVGKLRREIGRIAARDYFPSPARGRARASVEALARTLEAAS